MKRQLPALSPPIFSVSLQFFASLLTSSLVLTASFHTSFRNHCFWGTTTNTICTQQKNSPFTKRSELYSGYGIAEAYSWKEEALEIEVTVQVPPGTTAKDVTFKPGPTSIDLRVKQPKDENAEPLVLLDGNRKLRGRLSLDGVFWVFSDKRRSITLTLEKFFPHSADDMQVLDYDWKGVYPDDEDEVSERKYDEPEVLDVREYAASLGVDVDNINRSMVDETMFSSGLNLTQRTMDQLTEKGYLEEITKQADGTEYRTDPETGELEKITTAGDADDQQAAKNNNKQVKIPFIDTDSPWNKAVPVSVDPETNKTTIADEGMLRDSLKQNAKQQSKGTKAKNSAEDEEEEEEEEEDDDENPPDPNQLVDPIDMLTVKRLKEILKEQGLKVSGTKKELQDRLRNQVSTLTKEQTKQQNDKENKQT